MNWFDTAREVTERWRHQQQIRRAPIVSGIGPLGVKITRSKGGIDLLELRVLLASLRV